MCSGVTVHAQRRRHTKILLLSLGTYWLEQHRHTGVPISVMNRDHDKDKDRYKTRNWFTEKKLLKNGTKNRPAGKGKSQNQLPEETEGKQSETLEEQVEVISQDRGDGTS